jgi:hypothetical protein
VLPAERQMLRGGADDLGVRNIERAGGCLWRLWSTYLLVVSDYGSPSRRSSPGFAPLRVYLPVDVVKFVDCWDATISASPKVIHRSTSSAIMLIA